jgi:predicted transglutaminase-like cysteine proteinase
VQWEDDNEALPHATVRDAFLALPLPLMNADPAGWGMGCLSLRVTQWLRLWLPRMLIAGLALAALQPQAYDAEKMLAAAQKQGPRALAGVRALHTVLAASGDLDDEGKLAALNQFFNRRIQSREDAEVWGQVDYWASPIEMLEKGAGDCEDFAIAKYFSLLALGMPVNKLRLVYVRAQLGGVGGVVQAHMVLAYYAAPNAEPLILDNLVTELRPASRRPDLAPVFSFNSEGLWQGVGTQSAGDPTARLSRWREVLAKARTEGFQ